MQEDFEQMKEDFEQMMEFYNSLKQQIRKADPHLYERWKAGGFLVDHDIVSMYPDMGQVVETLVEVEEEEPLPAVFRL